MLPQKWPFIAKCPLSFGVKTAVARGTFEKRLAQDLPASTVPIGCARAVRGVRHRRVRANDTNASATLRSNGDVSDSVP